MLAFLANAALYVVPFLFLITVIVTVHEFGHFLTARAFGVAVDRFSVGFGRAIVSFKDRWGVEWRIGWMPLGGYVRFAGDDNASSVPDRDDLGELKAEIAKREGAGAVKNYFHFKPLWQRALIVAAGPAINFVFSILIFSIMFGCVGETVVSMKVMEVQPGTAAAAAGLLPGDRITGADGRRIDRYEDLQAYVQARPGVPMQVSLNRAGRDLTIPITPRLTREESPAGGKIDVGVLGIAGTPGKQYYQPVQAVWRGVTATWDIVAKTSDYIGRLVTGKAQWQLQGFLGTAHVTGALTKQTIADSQAAHSNLAIDLTIQLAALTAFFSTSIGMVNLLPIPVLDGGHLVFYAYEAVARRPLPASAQAAGYRVGLALLVGLMLFTAWHDLQSMQVFHFLGALFS